MITEPNNIFKNKAFRKCSSDDVHNTVDDAASGVFFSKTATKRTIRLARETRNIQVDVFFFASLSFGDVVSDTFDSPSN